MKIKTIVLSINASWNIINFRTGLIKGLQEAGYRVVAIAPTDAHSHRLASLGVEHFPIEIDSRGTSPFADLKLLWEYYRLLGRIRPNAFLGYTVKPNVFGSLAAHLRGIAVINNIAGLGQTFVARSWMNRIVRLLYSLSLRRSAVVFFQNPDDLRLFVSSRIVSKEKARALPGSGIDLTRFVPIPSSPVRPGEFTFLLISRLLWAKGIGDYAEAAKVLRQRGSRARFQLLGLAQTGRDAISGETLAGWQDAGLVEFLGGADDVRPFIAKCDSVVLPTAYPEGTPRVLLEAAAMGKPLIATNVPGCREIVVNESNGFLCPPRDPEALAVAMEKLMELPPTMFEEFGRRSRGRVENHFDERIVIDRYLDALAEIGRDQSAER